MYTLSNMAAVLHHAKQDTEAFEVLRVQLRVRKYLLNSDPKACDILGNLGNTLLNLGKRDESKVVFTYALALRLKQRVIEQGPIANIQLALGNISLLEKDYLRALVHYKDGIHRLLSCLPEYYHPILPGMFRNVSLVYRRKSELETRPHVKQDLVLKGQEAFRRYRIIKEAYHHAVRGCEADEVAKRLIAIEKEILVKQQHQVKVEDSNGVSVPDRVPVKVEVKPELHV